MVSPNEIRWVFKILDTFRTGGPLPRTQINAEYIVILTLFNFVKSPSDNLLFY